MASISLVIVSYNQARFLEQAIVSALSQDPPPHELFVVDGGSTDGSAEIIARYSDRLTRWVSEKDRGQSHAINKGLAWCTGDVINWLCSDDLLLPGALAEVTEAFRRQPDLDVVAGNASYLYNDGSCITLDPPVAASALPQMPAVNLIVQPSCFFRRRLVDRGPYIREDLHYIMDLELWDRFVRSGARWHFTEKVLSVYRITGDNKSVKGASETLAEIKQLYRDTRHPWFPADWWFERLWVPLRKCEQRVRPPLARKAARRLSGILTRALALFYPRELIHGFATSFQWYVLNPWIQARPGRVPRRRPSAA